MRRFLPPVLVILLGLLGWYVLRDSDPVAILDGPLTESTEPTAELDASAETTGSNRIGTALAEVEGFTNRPLKQGRGRHGLHGMVVDESGSPVGNVWVAAYSSPFPIADFIDDPAEILEKPLEFSLEPLASTYTDKDGLFDLAGVPGRTIYLTARSRMRLSVGRQHVSPRELDGSQGVTIKTVAAAALEGRVSDAQGNAVANAEVLVTPALKYLLAALRKREIFLERTFTDSAGRFELEAVPAGMVLSVHAFNGPTHPGMAEFGPAGRNVLASVTVPLVELGEFGGAVLNTDGDPVSGAHVAAIPLDLRFVIPVLRNVPGWMATTNGAGQYHFAGLPFGQYLMVAQGVEGRSTPHTGHIVSATGSGQDLVLDTRNAVSGRVIDSAGKGISGATLTLMSVPEKEGGSSSPNGFADFNFILEMAREVLPEILPADTVATSGAGGKFRLAAWSQARVRVSAPGYVTGDFKFGVVPEEMTPALVLQRPGSIEGVVMEKRDQPDPVQMYILQAELRGNVLGSSRASDGGGEIRMVAAPPPPEILEEGDQAEAGVEQLPDTPRTLLMATLEKDEYLVIPEAGQLDKLKQSRFVDHAEGKFKIVGLAPGNWRLRARANGFETSNEAVEVVEGKITSGITINLGLGSSVAGIVIDKNTQDPVESALVSIDNQEDGGFALMAQGFGEGSPIITTKSDGSFLLPGIEAGSSYAHVMVEGYAIHSMKIEPLAEGEQRVGLTIEVSPGGGITGRVTDRHETPLPQRMVLAFSPGSKDFHQSGTDQAGVYLIEHLRPGNYMLISVSLDDDSLFTGDIASVLAGGRFVSAIVEEGKTTTVDIVDSSAGGCRLSGQLIAQGTGVRSAVLTATAMGGAGILDFRMANARTDENGNFVFKSLAPGEYSVNIDSETWSGSLDLFVDDIPEDFVELRIPETVVSGQILAGVSQSPLAGIRIRMVREDGPQGMGAMFGGGGSRRSAVTDEQGSYRIEGAPSGDYHLVIEPDARGNFDPESDSFQASNASFRKTESRSFFLDEDENLQMDPIHLESGGAVHVSVRDGDGKEFERGFSITALPVGDADPEQDDDLSSWGWNGEGTLAGLPAGSWRIKVGARGYAAEIKEVTVSEGQVAELNFELAEGVDMLVRVIGPDGKAAPSAAVTVYDNDGKKLNQEGGQASLMQRFFSGTSDGTRSVGSYRPGTYKVVATFDGNSAETYATLQSGQSQVIEIQM
jgi:hypothetical protein